MKRKYSSALIGAALALLVAFLSMGYQKVITFRTPTLVETSVDEGATIVINEIGTPLESEIPNYAFVKVIFAAVLIFGMGMAYAVYIKKRA